jgi:Na+/H+ antiporter NhaD/arsenite permease-like protein
MGGNVLMLGSMSGLALMKMERVHVGWYLRHVGGVVALSWAIGMLTLWVIHLPQLLNV